MNAASPHTCCRMIWWRLGEQFIVNILTQYFRSFCSFVASTLALELLLIIVSLALRFRHGMLSRRTLDLCTAVYESPRRIPSVFTVHQLICLCFLLGERCATCLLTDDSFSAQCDDCDTNPSPPAETLAATFAGAISRHNRRLNVQPVTLVTVDNCHREIVRHE